MHSYIRIHIDCILFDAHNALESFHSCFLLNIKQGQMMSASCERQVERTFGTSVYMCVYLKISTILIYSN